MVRLTTMDLERQRWTELNRRVSNGDEDARGEFIRRYGPGVRAVLRRQLGAVGLERLVNETLDGALSEIESGKIRQPRDLVRFVRQVAARGQSMKSYPTPQPEIPATPILSSADQTVLRKRVQAADKALSSFNPVEREILVCYYARGFSRQDIEAEFNLPVEEFDKLRERLIEALSPPRKKKFPQANQPALVRRAAASGI